MCSKEGNTGHDGSISTGHANSSEDMLARLETMVLMGIELPLSAIRRQLASGIDIIVHLGRLRDKSRRVLEICEVMGVMDGEVKMEKLYEFKEESVIGGRINGSLVKTGSLKNREKLHRGGMSLEGD